ncbi:hypothetical protein RPATATE_0856 [Rickettsia parkeri str. Tate's Hell]|uniref:Uncharacterized protein n=2 Tax=Rickettsia parkeri TaxID=35792 RepID=A0ABR5DRL9_RICPA|nr:hypothetical protein RPATATE_0856 [Rickettsia parkeri str. Tate's Hell]
MGEDGTIYMGTHKNQYLPNTKNLVHDSFLIGKPAEAAGVIGINDRRKIDYLRNNSGHYQPEALEFKVLIFNWVPLQACGMMTKQFWIPASS